LKERFVRFEAVMKDGISTEQNRPRSYSLKDIVSEAKRIRGEQRIFLARLEKAFIKNESDADQCSLRWTGKLTFQDVLG
jgi:hypothetical protein